MGASSLSEATAGRSSFSKLLFNIESLFENVRIVGLTLKNSIAYKNN